jgi:sigma-B regulation protein RsbU (phosphoserine phosphatase)
VSSGDDLIVKKALPEEDAQELYDKAPCGYVSTDPDGLIVRANETFLLWTGFTAEEIVGKRRLSTLLTAGGRIFHDTHYAPMLLMQNTAREIALDIVTASGSRLPVLLNATLDRGDDGEPRLVRIIMIDATERRQYERELLAAKDRAESLARTLERTLLPPSLPEIPGLDVAAAYLPAGEGGQVGGDFYDVFQIAEDDWVAVLGDVQGKGVDAAVITALARHTIRAATVRLPEPDETVHVLDEVIKREQTNRFCTVALVRLRRQGDSWRASLCLGGHHRPLLLEPGAEPTTIGNHGPIVGVLNNPTFTKSEHLLAPRIKIVL